MNIALSFPLCFRPHVVPAALAVLTLAVPTILLGQVTRPEDAPGYADGAPASSTEDRVRMGVQMSEVGLMRALFLLDSSAADHRDLIAQRFSDVHFRVFPGASVVEGTFSGANPGFTDLAGYFAKQGNDANADLVVYAKVSSREKRRLGNAQLHEAEASVQIFSPVSGELLAIETVRGDGTRHVDEVEARRSAREKAVDAATRSAIVKGLQKAHKLLVHNAVINGVQSHDHLLSILVYMKTLDGVYHVRQLSYDSNTKRAVVEIIGAPQTASFWRAHMQNLPKAQAIDWDYIERRESLQSYPSWFPRSE